MWRPLIESEAARVRGLVRTIVERCLAIAPLATQGFDSLEPSPSGQALVLAWAERLGFVRRTRGAVDARLTTALEVIQGQTPSRWSAFGPLGGTVWTLAHLRRRTSLNIHGILREYAGAARRSLKSSDAADPFDLASGCAGVVVVGAEMPATSARQSLLRAAADWLVLQARVDDGGAFWIRDEDTPRNFGMAHGQPGVIAALSRCIRATPRRSDRDALQQSCRWLIARRLPAAGRRWFTTTEARSTGACNAWCYGDAGVALALVYAARVLCDDSLRSFALSLARSAARRSARESEVRDATLCHGSAGLAHVFSRFYALTSDPTFERAARRWYRRTFDYAEQGGVFRRARSDGERELDDGFLTGSLGVALALMAGTSPVTPSWDRLLFADVS